VSGSVTSARSCVAEANIISKWFYELLQYVQEIQQQQESFHQQTGLKFK
jgi:hypothetical protein